MCVCCVMLLGAGLHFCLLAWMVSGLGPFASVIFNGHVWGLGGTGVSPFLGGAHHGFSLDQRDKNISTFVFLPNLLFLDLITSASKHMLYNLGKL